VLIIVQNLPVPLDRRVWQESLALRDAGYVVSVVCPKAPGDPDYELYEGVHLHKYAPPPATRGVLSYVVEFAYCWVRTSVLAVRVANEPEKQMLLASDDEKFFTEPHYNGFPAVLVRLAELDAEELTELLTDAWRTKAPKKLLK